MSDDDSSDDASHSSANIDSMTDAEVREWHERNCEEGDEWSHAFEFFNSLQSGELCTSIENPRRRVMKLFSVENWNAVGGWLKSHTICNEADLSDCGLTTEHAEALFSPGGRPYQCPLKYINLSNNPLGARGVAAFVGSASQSIASLNMNDTPLGSEGTRLLSEGLNGDMCIEALSIENTNIGGRQIECLLAANNSVRLRELRICNNVLGIYGVRAVATFLGRDDTALEKLTMNCETAYHATVLYESLSRNSKLEELSFWDSRTKKYVVPEAALPSLMKLVCGAPTLHAVCQCNHRLKYAAGEWNRPIVDETHNGYSRYRYIYEALMINQRSNQGLSENQIVRAKLRSFFFNDHYWKERAFDVRPLVDLDVELMPHVLELTRFEATVGRDTYYPMCAGNIGSIYRLIKNYPVEALFGFTRQEETKMQQLEAENARLRKQVAELLADRSHLPNKRAK